MLTNLVIKNFKSHINTNLELKNLNVLTGINGCGKTSVIQSMLLLRQSFQKGCLKDGLDLNEPLCSIGNGQDALYRRAESGELSFSLETTKGESFLFCFNANEKFLSSSFLEKKNFSNNVLDDNLKAVSLFNNDFQYISASRWGGRSSFPKDTLNAENRKQISKEFGQGELIANFLNKFGNDDVADYTNGKEKDLSLLNQAIFWERKISPNVTFNIASGMDGNSFVISYGFEDYEGVSPIRELKAENIGFGISYSLPVVVALLSAKPGALIIIENPEAHLHPSGQSELAKLITMVAKNGVQIILETHSDHIITAIQIACKEYEKNETLGIDKANVSISYFTNKNGILNIERLEIAEKGSFAYQPKGFFDQAEIDFQKMIAD